MEALVTTPLPGRLSSPIDDDMVSVSLRIRRGDVQKLHAFMASDSFEKAEAARNARLEDCLKSLEHCVNLQRRHAGTSGGRVMASFLASLYNGNRVKVDVSDIRCLDSANFEHLMNALRLVFECNAEPHTFFEDGNEIFEAMIKDWRLEKKRRTS